MIKDREILEEKLRRLDAYEVTEHHELADIRGEGYLLRHRKSGARVVLMPNEDSNKVFFIGFRTPPTDSSGVAHIIEHTVLCGSREFPLKDPFIEAAKGSLNTFLNAMTYPDKTMYPVASTNAKDFANLMHIYLDAVFHPNIYTNENIFRQEGWHYEVKTAEAADGKENESAAPELVVNGVVYNEMKGVMSSPDDVLNDAVLASLFPDTTYAIVSGGDPQVIPQLTYEQYLEFHKRYYHPSNSYIYLYGDMDMAERLDFLDRCYLSEYDFLKVDSSIHPQQPFAQPVESEKSYSILAEESPENKAFLSWNAALPIHGDPKKILAFKILDYVLCDAEGAPVKEALREKGIGQTVESLYESGIYEPYYSIAAKYADPEAKEEFEHTIVDTLKELVRNGIDRKAIMAGINFHEFHYREADFGSYPKGLVYGLDLMDTWLYDEDQVWSNLELGHYFDELKADAENGYFEALIQDYLLDNTHKSAVMLVPEQGLNERLEKEQKEKLAEYAGSLSNEELQRIKDAEEALRKWQNTPDSEEAMASIPVLERSDLEREPRYPVTEVLQEEGDGFMVLAHPSETNGIDYLDLSFDVTDLEEELMPYLGICKILIGAMDTKNYSYQELDNEINIVTGGITPEVSGTAAKHAPEHFRILFELSMKVVDSNLEKALALAGEMLLSTDWSDAERMQEVLEEERASMKAELAASGHSTAVMRAGSMLSPMGAVMDDLAGIGLYRLLDEICSHFEEYRDKLQVTLRTMMQRVICRERFFADITAQEDSLPGARQQLAEFCRKLPGDGKAAPVLSYWRESGREPNPRCREGYTTAGQIQFVCRAGDYSRKGLEFRGDLRVLRVILGYDYLWTKIRMLGGAYGCMSGFGMTGTSYFVSYRDPKLRETIEAYEEAADYIRNFHADEKTMTKYVIGAVSALDRPMTPSMLGKYSKSCYLTGTTREDLASERLRILECGEKEVQELADYVQAFMDDGILCVVGSAAKIRESGELFDKIETLAI
jgi:presequence protease